MLAKNLSEQERIDWIRLTRSENVGARTFTNLIEMFGSPTDAIARIPELAKRGGKRQIKVASASDVEKEIKRCESYGARLILACDPEYPEHLKHISDYPPVITVKGNVELLNKRSIAIVGARNSSANGCNFAKRLAEDLSHAGVTVVSGLAKGIDTYAHQGSLKGGTIAVIAGGIDYIYPKENEMLYHDIADQGIIIAELPIGAAPIARHFPQRNRIISGISLGTVVVEAAKKSGSLITAKFALEQNREVFAVPGSPLDPRCHGTNALIKQGAHLIESADDVLELIEELASRQQSLFSDKSANYNIPEPQEMPSETELSECRVQLLEKLGFSPISIDEIIAQTGMSPRIANFLIIELELAGKVERSFGNRICLIA